MTFPADVPAGAAQPDVLRAEEVEEVARDFSHKLRVVALAASHELLRARLDAAERNERHMRNLHDWRVKDLDAAHLEIDAREFRAEAAALAGGRAADVLRELKRLTPTVAGGMNVSVQMVREIARAAVEAYDAEARP